jgi:hypothetical protein
MNNNGFAKRLEGQYLDTALILEDTNLLLYLQTSMTKHTHYSLVEVEAGIL